MCISNNIAVSIHNSRQLPILFLTEVGKPIATEYLIVLMPQKIESATELQARLMVYQTVSFHVY